MKDSNLIWKHVKSEQGDDLGILQVRFDWLEHPRSKKVMKRLVLESVDWINVVALTEQRESIMVKQYRFGISQCTVETPGGMVDPGEEPLIAAKRELLEETGYSSEYWSYLGAVEPNPAFHPHLCHHFLAENCLRTSDPDLGAGEEIEISLLNQDQLKAAMNDGSLQHVLALSALTRVFSLWDLPFTNQAI